MNKGVPIADLKGYWALVTGASSGIGRAYAERLAGHGLHVALVARRGDRLATIAGELAGRYGVSTEAIAADLAEPDSIDGIEAVLRVRDIRLRVLVNNAAIGHWGDFAARDEAYYARMIQLNNATMVGLCRRFLPDLRSHPSAAIVNVASGASFQPVPYMAVYAASKAFVAQFSFALHEELAKTGVLVQTLVPGPTATEFDALAGAPTALVGRGSVDEVVDRSIARLASGHPFATNAKGTGRQRAFAGLAPFDFVTKTVGKMFRPANGS